MLGSWWRRGGAPRGISHLHGRHARAAARNDGTRPERAVRERTKAGCGLTASCPAKREGTRRTCQDALPARRHDILQPLNAARLYTRASWSAGRERRAAACRQNLPSWKRWRRSSRAARHFPLDAADEAEIASFASTTVPQLAVEFAPMRRRRAYATSYDSLASIPDGGGSRLLFTNSCSNASRPSKAASWSLPAGAKACRWRSRHPDPHSQQAGSSPGVPAGAGPRARRLGLGLSISSARPRAGGTGYKMKSKVAAVSFIVARATLAGTRPTPIGAPPRVLTVLLPFRQRNRRSFLLTA